MSLASTARGLLYSFNLGIGLVSCLVPMLWIQGKERKGDWYAFLFGFEMDCNTGFVFAHTKQGIRWGWNKQEMQQTSEMHQKSESRQPEVMKMVVDSSDSFCVLFFSF